MYQPKRFRFETFEELRKKNKSIVASWFDLDPSSSVDVEKMQLMFHPYGRKELRYQLDGPKEFVLDGLKNHHLSLPESYLSWQWEKVKITGTQFPNVFWAFSSGSGVISVPEETEYSNDFLHLFVLEDDKFRLVREWSDSARALAARGFDVPYV
ncbi:MAG: PhzA/PhzB family protein [Cryobacterium sp.]|jgi:hypothetical protein|nr:PhzA/PhzB family protein [Cryobacterium sp.]